MAFICVLASSQWPVQKNIEMCVFSTQSNRVRCLISNSSGQINRNGHNVFFFFQLWWLVGHVPDGGIRLHAVVRFYLFYRVQNGWFYFFSFEIRHQNETDCPNGYSKLHQQFPLCFEANCWSIQKLKQQSSRQLGETSFQMYKLTSHKMLYTFPQSRFSYPKEYIYQMCVCVWQKK